MRLSPIVLLGVLTAGAGAQTTRLELGPDGRWVERVIESGAASELIADRAALDHARRLVASASVDPADLEGAAPGEVPSDPPRPGAESATGSPGTGSRALKEAFAILNPWIEEHRRASHPLLAEAYLLRGDAWVAARNEWKALYDYEALIKQFPGSEEFARAVEREVEIGTRYANGLWRKQFGWRIIDATSEGQELLLRASERMPGSALAERAQIELADSYLANGDWELATETYEIFLTNFPRSVHRQRAMKNLIAGHVRGYKGPRYDGRGLLEARALIERFRDDFPADADRAGLSRDLINRIDEQLAAQAMVRVRFYERRGDGPAMRLVLRRVVEQYPGTAAAQDARAQLVRRGWETPEVAAPPRAAAPSPPPPSPATPQSSSGGPGRAKPRRRPADGKSSVDRVRRRRAAGASRAAAVLAIGLLAACSSDPSRGYSFKSAYVENVRSVAVPIAENRTFSKGLEVALTEALIKEIQRSTPWVVVAPEGADAVLSTTINDANLRTLSTGRITGMAQEVAVTVSVDFDFRLSGGRSVVSRRNFQGVGTFVPAQGTQERLELGQAVSVQKLARDMVSELRSSW